MFRVVTKVDKKTSVISIPKDQLVDLGDYQEEKVGFKVNQGKVTLSLNDM